MVPNDFKSKMGFSGLLNRTIGWMDFFSSFTIKVANLERFSTFNLNSAQAVWFLNRKVHKSVNEDTDSQINTRKKL
jgi:hypothetical protein